MSNQSSCQFAADSRDPGRKRCLVCGQEVISPWSAERLHYPCGVDLHAPPPQATLTAREQIEAAVGDAEHLAATLDRCFGGCPHFDGAACSLALGSACRRRASWIRLLATYGGRCLADVRVERQEATP